MVLASLDQSRFVFLRYLLTSKHIANRYWLLVILQVVWVSFEFDSSWGIPLCLKPSFGSYLAISPTFKEKNIYNPRLTNLELGFRVEGWGMVFGIRNLGF